MIFPLLRWVALILACGLYLACMVQWAYLGRWRMGLVAVLVAFPGLLYLSQGGHGLWLRGIPLLGVAMFIHRLKTRFLRSISLLWFTTLTVLVAQGYYAWLVFTP
jgi:hypothetical protein